MIGLKVHVPNMMFVTYLSESNAISDGLTDIEDAGIFVQNNEKAINGLYMDKIIVEASNFDVAIYSLPRL